MGNKRAPRNTAKEVHENPILGLAVAMGDCGSGILAQEAQGQSSFVGSDTLPTDMGFNKDYNTKAILEAAGVKFLGVVEGDDMFQYVELPEGWKKVATSHSMHSKLVDDKGRERASIFYKAAFYDRSANMSICRRFSVSFDWTRFDKDKVGVTNVTDGDKVVYTTEPLQAEDKKGWDVEEVTNKVAIEWLDESYPDWRNPGAYWD